MRLRLAHIRRHRSSSSASVFGRGGLSISLRHIPLPPLCSRVSQAAARYVTDESFVLPLSSHCARHGLYFCRNVCGTFNCATLRSSFLPPIDETFQRTESDARNNRCTHSSALFLSAMRNAFGAHHCADVFERWCWWTSPELSEPLTTERPVVAERGVVLSPFMIVRLVARGLHAFCTLTPNSSRIRI